ncbi:MAG TPA: hypothetical protein PK926_03780 [Spirochaetota bacterium]|nr:hypothetical protein [Spirochaetota bacterium]HPI91169.1 hypothetical protein [Spirochaetota bacterium]HPR46917.1 hypothetical protein [Spirochaetota bacterium]
MEIKTITERNTFNRYFDQYFLKNDTYVKSRRGNIEVDYLGYFNGLAALKFPVSLNDPSYCLLFSRLNENIAIASMNFYTQKDRDVFLYSPQKFQIINSPRNEKRSSLKIVDQKIIIMSEVMTDGIIRDGLMRKGDKLNAINEVLRYQKRRNFDYVKTYFISEPGEDPRMKYFIDGKTKLFIADMHHADENQDLEAFRYYKTTILPTDNYLNYSNDLMSEITLPITYKGAIPYGYVQVNSRKPLSAAQVGIVERMVALAQNMAAESRLFYESDHRFLVSDVSPNGFGIVFRNKMFLPVFLEKSLVSMDLILPQKRKASIFATVRHVEIKADGVVRVGFKINRMDENSSLYYQRFVQTCGA